MGPLEGPLPSVESRAGEARPGRGAHSCMAGAGPTCRAGQQAGQRALEGACTYRGLRARLRGRGLLGPGQVRRGSCLQASGTPPRPAAPVATSQGRARKAEGTVDSQRAGQGRPEVPSKSPLSLFRWGNGGPGRPVGKARLEALARPVCGRARDTGEVTPAGGALASLVAVLSESVSAEPRESGTPANLEWPGRASHGPRRQWDLSDPGCL